MQLWPCNGTNAQQWFDPPKLPVTDLNGSPITISAVSLNNGSNLLVGVQPGQTISATLTYTIAQMASCPYCIDQIMIGFPDQFLGCVYNGIPSASGVAGTGSLSLSAPATPGVYYLRFHYAMGYYCAAGSWSIWPATEANDIAVITVR